MNVALKSIIEQRDFVVSSSSLKEVRSFSREVFEKVNIDQDLKDELVLAIAEAAQNIVKHAYQGEDTEDKMEIKISLEQGHLEIGFFLLVFHQDIEGCPLLGDKYFCNLSFSANL